MEDSNEDDNIHNRNYSLDKKCEQFICVFNSELKNDKLHSYYSKETYNYNKYYPKPKLKWNSILVNIILFLIIFLNEPYNASALQQNESKIASPWLPTVPVPSKAPVLISEVQILPSMKTDMKESAGLLSSPPDIYKIEQESNNTALDCGETSVHGHGTGITLITVRWAEVGVYLTITIFVIVAGLAKLAFHKLHWLSSRIPESCLLLVLGIGLGFILHYTTHETDPTKTCHTHVEFPHFTSDIFFMVLLPPIVLESAYSLHDRVFFENLGTILVFAVIGTMFNMFIIGGTLYGAAVTGAMGSFNMSLSESFVFSSLISAVDPVAVLAIFAELSVNKELYFLVFGESLLNDGVTVVLYNTMKQFMYMGVVEPVQYVLAVVAFFIVAFGGIFIGFLFGIVTALVTKATAEVRVVEPLATLGLAYMCYLTAELFHFSGIISLTVCGLVQSHYAFENVSQKTYICVKYFTKMASATSDAIIFMFLGMVMVSDSHVWHWEFVTWTLVLCLVVRFFSVFLFSFIVNHYRIKKINYEEQFIAAYGGLRGAVAFSLVTMLNDKMELRDVFVTTTLVVILFTIMIQGTTIKLLVTLLKIKRKGDGGKKLIEEINSTAIDHVMAGIEEILGQHGDFYLKEVLKHYDEIYMKRFLLRPVAENSLTRLYQKIVISEHYAHLYGPVALIEENVKPILVTEKEQLRRSSSSVKKLTNELILNPSKSAHRKMSQIGRRSRVDSETSSITSIADDNHALRKALRDHPYNKLHYTYNRNLVDEDDQEIEEHQHRRHKNARRMSRFASQLPGDMPMPTDRFSAPTSRKRGSRFSTEDDTTSLLPGVPTRPTTEIEGEVEIGAAIFKKRHRMSSIRRRRESRKSHVTSDSEAERPLPLFVETVSEEEPPAPPPRQESREASPTSDIPLTQVITRK